MVVGTINVVLLQPEIPQNTGNIARTCAVAGAVLHLVEPLGFHLTERNLKRSGCDYWDDVEIVHHASTEAFLRASEGCERYFFTGRAEARYTEPAYGVSSQAVRGGESKGDVYLVFGRESRGIDDEVLERFASQCVRIPMREGMRSLNLSNAVAVGVYEVIRQWEEI